MAAFRKIRKPGKDEYSGYSHIYMDLLKDDDLILDHLYKIFFKIKEFIYSLPVEKLIYRYAENKWTIKEILVHVIDTERIFAYRALRYARNDNTPLRGFEQDDYAKCYYADRRSLDNIFEEYRAVRNATILLFQNLPEDSFMRSGGSLDDHGNIINVRTVRAWVYHIAVHELKHIKTIKERYLDIKIDGKII
jgi:uncharacterized damage-inducible protein DinB